MKMKKTLIALAVAGAFAAPAFAASSNVDIYGKFRVSLDHLNQSRGWGLNDEGSRVGFKGAEDLGGGLKAIYQYETYLSDGTNGGVTTGGATGGIGAQRDTFVGLSGSWGTAIAGRHDTPYKMAGSADLYADTAADAQNTGTLCIICEDVRTNNAIAYVSPSFSGLTVVGAIVPGKNQDTTATTKSLKSLTDAVSVAAMYGNGPLSLSAGYENLEHYAGNALNSAKQSAYKLNGSYTIGDLKLGATYEKIKHDFLTLGADQDQKGYLLSAAYGMGPITLAAQYGERNPDGSHNNLKDFTLGAVYSLSKRTNTYVAYAHYKADDLVNAGGGLGNNLNVLTMGINHDF
jgi:predicted porin